MLDPRPDIRTATRFLGRLPGATTWALTVFPHWRFGLPGEIELSRIRHALTVAICGNHGTEAGDLFAMEAQRGVYFLNLRRFHHGDHADATVECAQHVRLRDVAD